MEQEQSHLKQQLERELSGLQFSQQEEVVRRTHPTTVRGRLRAFWNKELELPIILLGTVFALLLTAAFLYHAARQPKSEPAVSSEAPQQRELIETGGSIYWKDEFERRLARYEDPDQG
ncbi:hypothetical protein GRF59_08225 [Paenibacillus sp. HJL G12]|uniref:Uncharacterized protein n=1 Tax=Paenibacillus dendrobii TaxID=2691084 RepID=A0A7X3IJ92_9BACL|nr:hypothetical protein [Paenibacillus dendrobii]MWV43620.1 hypothetical protein [Paenibacillus dendrobii]